MVFYLTCDFHIIQEENNIWDSTTFVSTTGHITLILDYLNKTILDNTTHMQDCPDIKGIHLSMSYRSIIIDSFKHICNLKD